MMSFKARSVMFAVINIFMAGAMSVTADLLHGAISYRTLIMMLIGFAVGMVLSYIIPFDKISAWTCRICRVKREGIAGGLVGNIIPAFMNTAVIGAVMTAINVSPIKLGFSVYINAYLSVIWILIPISYVVACFANPLAVRAGLAVERNIRKKDKEDEE
ncbi:MAG: hypothetical protein ACI4QR_06695 [Eubacteriales bacterium]